MKSRLYDFEFEENLKLPMCDPVARARFRHLQPQAVSKARVEAKCGHTSEIDLIGVENQPTPQVSLFL